eukprot:CAMPEP_0185277848 /NCGR_PEP_ID=MMETSP1359-20130426/59611_1 /TAXON_ID=552665 /ORGANISM="Bigelowiella longifila, Strain CCMP242" /LENGTH=156 /DNA_ID=CAMNT_0027872123 /DNA_START=120 /DNA_END=587 /DNA_ORIENTATION=+
MVFCTQCGTKLGDKAKFCSKCGSNLEADSAIQQKDNFVVDTPSQSEPAELKANATPVKAYSDSPHPNIDGTWICCSPLFCLVSKMTMEEGTVKKNGFAFLFFVIPCPCNLKGVREKKNKISSHGCMECADEDAYFYNKTYGMIDEAGEVQNTTPNW